MKVIQTEKELLKRIAEGDVEAFSEVYKQYSGVLFGSVMALIKDSFQAQEITQQVFIKIWDKRQAMAEVRSLDNYLFILARNAAFNHFKTVTLQKKLISDLHPDTASDFLRPDIRFQDKEYGELRREAIGHLPPQQKQAYLLAEEQDMSNEAIAATMQLSKETVKRHLNLARQFVRSYVQQRYLILPALLFSAEMWNL